MTNLAPNVGDLILSFIKSTKIKHFLINFIIIDKTDKRVCAREYNLHSQ